MSMSKIVKPTDEPTPFAARAPAEVTVPAVARRLALLLAAMAGLCWAGALAMLLSGGMDAEREPLAAPRVIFCALVLVAGLLTFIPAQRQLRLPGLAFEGVAGTFLLFYTLAFVPPPTAWLLALPDAPVYVLFAAAVFWSVSAITIPAIAALGKRLFRQRARQYDLRRARRQAHEAGALVALSVGLAGLRLLTLFGVALLVLILVVAELLFLSFVETET
jgi:hypothetical protein